MFATAVRFGRLSLPHRYSSNDATRTQANDDPRDDEVCELECCGHQDAANALHEARQPDRLSPSEIIAEPGASESAKDSE